MKDFTIFNQLTAMPKRLAMVLTVLFTIGVGSMWGADVFNITSYSSSPSGWTNSNVGTGSYFNFNTNGCSLITSTYGPHTSLTLTYKVATYGSGTNHPLTIQLLDENGTVKQTHTTGTPTSSSYISGTWSIGDVNYKFKIKFYLQTAGKGVRLQVPKLVGTEAASCEKKVTIDKGTPLNGDFELSESGAQETCDGLTIVVTPTPHEHYVVNQVTATTPTTGGTPTIKDNGDDTWSVTYAANSTGSSTINVTFKESPRATITLSEAGSTRNPSGTFYVGDSYTLPSTTTATCGDKTFVGWSTVTIDNPAAKPKTNFYEPEASFTLGASNTFYAVFAESGGAPTISWPKTDIANINDGDEVVLVMNNSSNNYTLNDENGTSSPPDALSISVENDCLKLTEISDEIIWVLGKDNGNLTFYKDSNKEAWLYCTGTNNGVRVGTNTNKTFTIDATSGYLKHSGTSRYVGVYNSQDWRCYTSTTTNIGNQTLAFYKKTTTGGYQNYTTQCTTQTANSLLPKHRLKVPSCGEW